MSKPIQEQIFKSRLTITYRTNISGTVQQEKLPYRLLVLGEFAGRAGRETDARDLANRSVRSIKRGTTVDDHLSEVLPTWRVPAGPEFDALRSALPGRVTFDRVTCSIGTGAIERKESKDYLLSGMAKFESLIADNGMADIVGDLKVGGTVAVEITDDGAKAGAASAVVRGAISGTYIDPATGKAAGVITGHVEQTINLEAGAVTMVPSDELEDGAAAPADPKVRVFVIQVDAPKDVRAERTIPIPSMAAFTPDTVAMSLPEVHRLRVIKHMLLSLQSSMRNRPDLRKQVKSLLPMYGEKKDKAAEKLAAINELREWAIESFPLLRIDRDTQK